MTDSACADAGIERVFHSGEAPGTAFLHVPRTAKPAHATTQWMQFRFCSRDFFAHSPGSHFAVGLRGEIGFDGSSPVSLEGRGITIGHTCGIPRDPRDPRRGGCLEFADLPAGTRPGMSQIESFWPGGNFVYADTCRPRAGYRDGAEYRVTIHAHDSDHVAFWIDDGEGSRIDPGSEAGASTVDDPVNPVLTGYWIGLARDDDGSLPWSMLFSRLRTGWF